jgi:hypothetical protein
LRRYNLLLRKQLFKAFDLDGHGRVMQVGSFKIRVESAYGFSA